MSSPSPSPFNKQPIESLPIRPSRSINIFTVPASSGGSSQNATIDTSQSSPSLGVPRSDPVAIPAMKVNGPTVTEYLSPKPFVFGQNPQSNQLPAENTLFTFRSLHNASPQPPMMFAKPLKLAGPSSAAQPSETNSLQAPGNHKTDEIQQKLGSLNSSENLVRGIPKILNNAESLGPVEHKVEPDLQPQPHSTVPPIVPTNAKDLTRAPYDTKDEPAPTAPFYTTAFQSALKDGVGIAREAGEALVAVCALDDSPTLQRLKSMAEDLSKYRNSETKTIAVLGDSGEGKWLPP